MYLEQASFSSNLLSIPCCSSHSLESFHPQMQPIHKSMSYQNQMIMLASQSLVRAVCTAMVQVDYCISQEVVSML